MARKAKSVTATVHHDDDAAAGIGHNGEGLSEDEKIAQFFAYKKRWEYAKLTLKNLEEEIKTKIGKQGVRDIRTAVQLDTPEGEERLKEKIAAQMRIARWTGLPVGSQDDLFPEDRTPAVDAYRARGKRDGLAGNPCKPECDPSVPQYDHYMDGFHAGQAVLAKGIKAPADDADRDLRPRHMTQPDALA